MRKGVYQWPLTCGEGGPYAEASAVNMYKGTAPSLERKQASFLSQIRSSAALAAPSLEGSHPFTEAAVISLWHDPAGV